jgi:acyl-CoA thioesterase FadM
VDFVVAEARIRYSRPAVADDMLDIELAIGDLGATTMQVEFLMTRDGRRIARGELDYVFIDVVTERRAAVPPAVRDVLAELVVP